MSLTDPVESERRTAAALRGSPAALTAALLFGAGGLLAAAVLGLGVGGVFDQLRVVTLNSVFGNWDAGVPIAVRAAAIPVGVLACILLFGQYSKWNHRYTGRTTFFAFVGPLTLVLLGLALGTWVATTMWAAPDAIGVAVDPTFHDDEPWDLGAWIMYAAQWWLPGLLALLGIASLLGRIASGRYRARNSELAAEMLRSGSLVDAEVVRSPACPTDASRVAATITLRFEDAEGRSRWVKCHLLLPPNEVPGIGAHRPLVFDPRDPGDTTRIFVSPTGRSDASDFLPARAA